MGNCNRLAQPRIGAKRCPRPCNTGGNLRYDPSETWAAEGGLWIVREKDEDYGWKWGINLKFKKFVPCLVNLLVVLDFSNYKQTLLKGWIFCPPTCQGASSKFSG